MDENNLTMADLMEEVEKTMVRIRRGDIKTAKVVSIEDNGLIVNIGYHADGFIPWEEYSFDAADQEDVQIGDSFEVMILNTDDGEGRVIVSKKRCEMELALENIENMFKNKERFSVKLKEVVKGGLITTIQGIRAFIPGSQLSHTYVADLNEYVGQTIEVEIIEFDAKKRRVVLSGKAIAKEKEELLKAERLNSLVEGERYTGTVVKLMPYGAFVNLGGVEGLVHNNELSWVRIKHPSDVVKEGDQVEVTILGIDTAKGKISLGMKDMAMDPWLLETASLENGQILNGKVVKFMSFGAFVSLSENVEGLVHISQITDKRIGKPEEALELGQEVKVKILEIDRKNKKLSLSITAAIAAAQDAEVKAYLNQEIDEGSATVGDVLGSAFKELFNK